MKDKLEMIGFTFLVVTFVLVALGIGGLFWLTPDGPCLGLMSSCFK